MSKAYFAVTAESSNGGTYVASARTAGPWDPQLQHGGPPSALLVRAAERLVAVELDRQDIVGVRLAAEFVGPVPVGEVAVSAELVRAARSAALVRVTLSGAGRSCLDARVWLVHDSDTAEIAHRSPRLPEPGADLPGLGLSFPYGDSIDWRAERGSLSEPGPGVIWARPYLDLIAGEEMSGLSRVCLLGDSASGISAELDWDTWSFVNVDLDVHLSRPVEGEWVRIDAATRLGAHGSALARSTVSDRCGDVGCTAQTLVLSARSRR